MAQKTARGQITLIDLNDARTVNMFLSSNHPKTQIFNQDGGTYVPDYAGNGNALVITPELLVSGDNSPVLAAAPTWTINGTAAANFAGASVGASAPYALTINANMVSIDYMEIECSGTYHDSVTNMNIPVKASIPFSKSVNTGQLCMARIDTTCFYFKNEASGPSPASIELTALLIRGSGDDTTPNDATPYTVTWKRRTSSGWTTVTTTSGKWTVGTGNNKNKLTVYPDGVDGMETFRAEVKDTYSNSASYNKTFADSVSIVDMTDPYSLHISSTNGEVFKNGVVSTDLEAHVQTGGVDVDPTKYTISYAWTKYNADETQDTTFGTKTTKKISISGSDVSQRATFFCEATID